MIFSLLMAALVLGCERSVLEARPDDENGVLYGEDSRRPIDQEDAVETRVAEAMVAIMEPSTLRRVDEQTFAVQALPLQGEARLCEGAKFASEPSASFCTGVLVSSTTVVSAGHCFDVETCSDVRLVFGWGFANQRVRESDVYRCSRVLHLSRDETNGLDLVVVRLDRAVKGYRPLAVSSRALVPGDDVFVFGHPGGVPLKVSQARIEGAGLSSLYVKASADVFSGDSGAAVVTPKGELQGLVIGGEDDYEWDRARSCNVVRRCAVGACKGEDVLQLSGLRDILKK